MLPLLPVLLYMAEVPADTVAYVGLLIRFWLIILLFRLGTDCGILVL